MVCPSRLLNDMLIRGVRSHEAKKIMKEKMKIGDRVSQCAPFIIYQQRALSVLGEKANGQVLFYHSNTKEPGEHSIGPSFT
jgi:predicted RNA-binding protein with PUA-like domain